MHDVDARRPNKRNAKKGPEMNIVWWGECIGCQKNTKIKYGELLIPVGRVCRPTFI